eukprot:scaffold28026_cov125-Skeletonema_dohrnii-CCMP3373.AAC.1
MHSSHLIIQSIPCLQSEIEEALVRIKDLEGVEGYVICNNDGTVLRHQVDMTKRVAEDLAKRMSVVYSTTNVLASPTSFPSSSNSNAYYKQNLTKLATRATNVARDLNPNDDLRILRIKTGRKERCNRGAKLQNYFSLAIVDRRVPLTACSRP